MHRGSYVRHRARTGGFFTALGVVSNTDRFLKRCGGRCGGRKHSTRGANECFVCVCRLQGSLRFFEAFLDTWLAIGFWNACHVERCGGREHSKLGANECGMCVCRLQGFFTVLRGLSGHIACERVLPHAMLNDAVGGNTRNSVRMSVLCVCVVYNPSRPEAHLRHTSHVLLVHHGQLKQKVCPRVCETPVRGASCACHSQGLGQRHTSDRMPCGWATQVGSASSQLECQIGDGIQNDDLVDFEQLVCQIG